MKQPDAKGYAQQTKIQNIQSEISLLSQKKLQLVQDDENRHNILQVDVNQDHQNIDLIFSENYYHSKMKK